MMATKEWRDKNKEKMRKYRNEYYQRNKKRQIQHQLETKRQRKKEYKDWIKTQFCMDCGIPFNEHPEIAEHHHRNPKEKDGNVVDFIMYGVIRFEREKNKCDLICRNCHAIRHVNMK